MWESARRVRHGSAMVLASAPSSQHYHMNFQLDLDVRPLEIRNQAKGPGTKQTTNVLLRRSQIVMLSLSPALLFVFCCHQLMIVSDYRPTWRLLSPEYNSFGKSPFIPSRGPEVP